MLRCPARFSTIVLVEERALLYRLAARKFDAETAARLVGLLDRLTDPERPDLSGATDE